MLLRRRKNLLREENILLENQVQEKNIPNYKMFAVLLTLIIILVAALTLLNIYNIRKNGDQLKKDLVRDIIPPLFKYASTHSFP